ncbi:MAG TPA: hypothetical protein VJK53_02140 [Candidatus Paceibacterota bacterium]
MPIPLKEKSEENRFGFSIRPTPTDVVTIVKSTLSRLESVSVDGFIASGALSLSAGQPISVYSDEANARSGDGWIIKVAYDHFFATISVDAGIRRVLRRNPDAEARMAQLRKQAERAAQGVAQHAALQVLEGLNKLCIEAIGTSLVSYADNRGRNAFVRMIRGMNAANVVFR